MTPELKKALKDADFKNLMIRACAFADTTLRRYIWRGFRPTSNPSSSQASADGWTADDFVMEALRKLLEGERAFDPSKSLLENLNSATESLVWSRKRSSDRRPLVDYEVSIGEGDEPADPISMAQTASTATQDRLIVDEILAEQQESFERLRAYWDGDKEVQAYLDAMKEEFFTPRDISDVTDLTVEQIYEIRRKVRNHAKMLFGVPNFSELKRKIVKGS